jgi:membrane carboxypeptidase/penicillin-binding protein
MKALLAGGSGDGEFRRPRGVTTVPIDPTTGGIATSDCPDVVEEDFISGTEPIEECQEHRPGFLDSLGRFFGL